MIPIEDLTDVTLAMRILMKMMKMRIKFIGFIILFRHDPKLALRRISGFD